jgi:hypothetical protein
MSLERLAGRAIAQSTFFDPLVNLEFRAEFDRIPHVEILETIYGARPLGARKTVTLAFLSLLRLIRYLDAAGRYLVTPPWSRLVYLPLAAARSDGRALTLFLRRDARQWLAEGFEREVSALRAAGLGQAVPRLRADHRLLKELGSVLHTVGDRLGLELRRTFERALLPVETPKPGGGVEAAIEAAVVHLGGFIKWCVVAIGQVFDPGLAGPRVFEVYPDEPAELERLRREIWMFAQILRGFLAKAAASHESTERWSASSSHRFVFEFISYYRNAGHYLARRTGYERLGRLTEVLEVVAAMEVIQPERLADLVAEAEAFHGFMMKTFDALCAHPLLEENEFDRKEAAHTLRLYLDR